MIYKNFIKNIDRFKEDNGDCLVYPPNGYTEDGYIGCITIRNQDLTKDEIVVKLNN